VKKLTDIMEILKDKSMTMSFRMTVSDLQKLFNGQEMKIEIKGTTFSIKKVK
jgi:hypothetical protein